MARIILLLVLGMITYFMVRSLFKRPGMPEPKNEEENIPTEEGPKNGSDMKLDPVCKTYVDPDSSVFLIHENQKKYFCSEDCRKKFIENL